MNPRQAVVEQHWRQDEDGTFIVLMHSVRHHRAREAPRPFWSWFHPVRVEVRECQTVVPEYNPDMCRFAESSSFETTARLGHPRPKWSCIHLVCNRPVFNLYRILSPSSRRRAFLNTTTE